ncbi:hypothetical protein LguiA_025583 [Lonicera macranthoides]
MGYRSKKKAEKTPDENNNEITAQEDPRASRTRLFTVTSGIDEKNDDEDNETSPSHRSIISIKAFICDLDPNHLLRKNVLQ